MIGGYRIKICGLTSADDAAAAAGIGADYLGFILYSKSPRFLPLARYVELRADLPDLPQVAVLVQPGPDELAAARDEGFDLFQIHFSPTDAAVGAAASAMVGPGRLWLAPKLPPGAEIPPALLPLAATWLIDTYKTEGFGGTGRVGDWPQFRRYRAVYPNVNWVLAGGLAPENVGAAIRASGAAALDINSGVECAPGRKDRAKLAALRSALLAAG